MIPQLLAVQARLVQDHPHVSALHWPAVNRLTIAAIYAACGCRITRTRKVIEAARGHLRGHLGAHRVPGLPDTAEKRRARARYEQALLDNALVLATRTTAPHRRRKANHMRQP